MTYRAAAIFSSSAATSISWSSRPIASPTRLAFVRYRSSSRVEYDWVYNDADIDGSNIVWARDMAPARNAELMQYYPERHAWFVEPDEPHPVLRPYAK